ncbi:MAG: FAD-dependent oxidoreductase [Proteobacteria bacterium]|nr:FAD-dependent oxidoreductase [Pseudomonadota bacterium]MBI3498378.1 FAD-dependent oxidoreductase [Pseudomonadota bacterium]
MPPPQLALSWGFRFTDLYELAGLLRLDQRFVQHLREGDTGLFNRLMAARAEPAKLEAKDESELLIELAPHLDDFVGALFGLSREIAALASDHEALAPLFTVKRLFVQRRAAKEFKPEEAQGFDGTALTTALEARFGEALSELAYARHVARWLEDEANHADDLDLAKRYAAWALHAPEGRRRHGGGIAFRIPRRLDPHHLVPVETIALNGITMLRLPEHEHRHREGFALTDPGMDLTHALDQANYCIWCHNQGKDSCSSGLKDKKAGGFQKTVFGVTLAGCPLEEKISEMNLVKSRGHAVGALAIVAVDNPLCAATGHRICNDCMKSCIYQKQEPVDIPQVETRTLKDVLSLPWGFEIYGLLTRWNPLNLRRPLPKPASGYKVLVVGLGPAGFNLSHHLMNDGHAVAAIDGLKIEPLDQAVSGVTPAGARVEFRPIRDLAELTESLDDRVMAGFGGVAEYGITVRWDKNFLKIVRLLLERRSEFAMYGGVRFGGTLTLEDAFELGFDHVALCAGAGRPTIVPMRNGLARGVRAASDFLMALQLTGAAKAGSLANLQLRLPVVVIGGGLTAIDTATEARAYYPRQVEKFLGRFEALAAERGAGAQHGEWSEEEAEIAEEFLAHARAIRQARAAGGDIGKLIDSWGGVTIAYRRRLIDAPSYTLNHEEVAKALEEGIRFAENLTPREVRVDAYGHAVAVGFEATGLTAANEPTLTVLPARSVLIAAGTQPNTVLARESDGRIQLDGKYFQAYDENGEKVQPERLAKPSHAHVLMAIEPDGRAVSFFGDLHPSFAGNVVKAMGGTKQGYPVVSRVLARRAPTPVDRASLFKHLDDGLRARVHEIVRLTPQIVDVIVKAPFAARAFRPGQFYRLQNYEALSGQVDGSRLAMEGLALTGASVDLERGLVSTIVLEMGGSSDLCALLKPGEPVVLMGPTGTPTEIEPGSTVVLVGGGLGNAVLLSIGSAFRRAGARVLYFAGYKHRMDRYKVEAIEAAADVVVWCCDEPPGFIARRPNDRTFIGNIVEALRAYGEARVAPTPIKLADADRLIVIGSDRMMGAVAAARHGVLKPFLKPSHVAIGSINSPMQCMMKEICAQCLQTHRDPVTGAETVVFSCFNQDQSLDRVDFEMLHARLGQNSTQEKLAVHWIDRCLRRMGSRSLAE